MKYTAIIEDGPTSYDAYVPGLPGCVAVGDTVEEVPELIPEALLSHVELLKEYGQSVPELWSLAHLVEVSS